MKSLMKPVHEVGEPVVFLDVVKVIPPDDGGPVHLQLGHHTGEDTATDGHLKSPNVIVAATVHQAYHRYFQ